MKVSVIIPTYNRKKLLKIVLKFLFNQTYPKDRYEIIVVDNASTDKTKEMIASLSSPCKLRCLYEPRKGPHIARNLGIRNAKGEVILFVDSDIFAPPHLIQEHINYHKRFGEVIVSGPAVRTSNLNENFEDIEKRKFKKFWDLSGPSLITSNLSVKKKYLIKVGGFDEEFEGLGWHDWELGLRLTKLGLKAKRNLNAIVYHYKEIRGRAHIPALCERRRQRGINAVLYYKKHPTFKIKWGVGTHTLIQDKFLWWIDTNWGEKLFSWAEKNNERFLLNLLIKWKLDRAYAQGMREGIKKHKVKILPWMQV